MGWVFVLVCWCVARSAFFLFFFFFIFLINGRRLFLSYRLAHPPQIPPHNSWLPTHEALLDDDITNPQQQHGTCTLLCRFDKAEHASVALLRDGEAVQLGGGLGLVTVRLTVRGCFGYI